VSPQLVIDGTVATGLIGLSFEAGGVPDGLTNPAGDDDLARIEHCRSALSEIVSDAFASPDVSVESLRFESDDNGGAIARVRVKTDGEVAVDMSDLTSGTVALASGLDDSLLECAEQAGGTGPEVTTREVELGPGTSGATVEGASTLKRWQRVTLRLVLFGGLFVIALVCAWRLIEVT
jgi:hypothetical protein